MQVDPYGLMLVCVLCGALGYFIGWMGGVVEGREQERKRTRGVKACVPTPCGNCGGLGEHRPGCLIAEEEAAAGVPGTFNDQGDKR